MSRTSSASQKNGAVNGLVRENSSSETTTEEVTKKTASALLQRVGPLRGGSDFMPVQHPDQQSRGQRQEEAGALRSAVYGTSVFDERRSQRRVAPSRCAESLLQGTICDGKQLPPAPCIVSEKAVEKQLRSKEECSLESEEWVMINSKGVEVKDAQTGRSPSNR